MDRVELDNLTRTYYDAQGETFCALDHAALIWEQGHSIAIMGESGSGKSTLARLMIGLERPSEGRHPYQWRRYHKMELARMEKISWQDSSGIPGCWWNPKSIMEYIQKCRRSPCKPDRFFHITAKKTYC